MLKFTPTLRKIFSHKSPIVFMLICLFGVQVAHAQISGTVFRDFNGNGVQGTASPNLEPGAQGVIINAYNTAGVLIASYTSGATGAYSIPASGTYNGTLGSNTGSVASGAAVRLEFVLPTSTTSTNIQTPLSGIDFSSSSGSVYGSSIRFVSGGATGVNFAINNPQDYAGTNTNPYLAIPQYINGTSSNATSGPLMSVGSYQYSDTGNKNGTENPPNTKAIISQTGALWGEAYQRSTKTLYLSSVLRRHVGFGPLGAGGIYKVDMTNPTSNSGASSYIDVNTIGIPVGTGSRTTSGCDAVSTDILQPSNDIWGAHNVGKFGIGGLDFDDVSQTLWLVNLTDKKLYGIKNVSPTTTPTAADVVGGYAITLPSGVSIPAGDSIRPWAVRAYRGSVYVGMITDNFSNPYVATNLKGYILKFDPSNPSSGFSLIYTFPFDYYKASWGFDNALNNWSPWFDETTNPGAGSWQYPQPIISDLEFDFDGSIIIGIMDRSTMQGSPNNYDDFTCTTDLYSNGGGGGQGDILRVCRSATGYVSDQSGTGCSTTIPLSNQVTDTGITDKEYYWGDFGPEVDNTGQNEAAYGALAFLPGSGQVMTTATDPEDYFSGGLLTLNNTDGGQDNRYNIFNSSVQSGTMAKANGLGDIELIADPAPIEIGNRVWLDTDKDGVQDAGEAGISGIQVQLLKGSTVISTATTDANGNYYFSSAAGAAGANTDPIRYGITQLMPNMAYTVHFPTTATVSGTSYNLTTANSTTGGGTDFIDSDATATGDVSVLATDIPVIGANNHTFDVGYSSAPCTINTPTVTPTCNNNGTASDPSDDTFTFTINTTGTGVGATYKVDKTAPAPASTPFASVTYGSTSAASPSFPISGGNLTLTLTDNTTTTCNLTPVTVTAPPTCSSSIACSFTATNTTPVCSDNGTPNITTDDTYTFNVTATSVSGTSATGYNANDPLSTMGTYGTPKSFGPYTISGNGTLNITLTDKTTGTCTFALPAISAPSPCSTPIVAGQPDLELTKTADKTTAASGNTLTYTITLKNVGTADATGVKVKDSIPAGLTYVSSVPAQGTYTSSNGIWDVGLVAKGTTLTLTITVTVN
jgi:uncharacterized repeat protein (TIGR01451 family)